ncbi:MAG: hypothetical protein HC828_13455 [Blastochloris sp.]|nr:hypothetical protein [Blastochloris sp.]
MLTTGPTGLDSNAERLTTIEVGTPVVAIAINRASTIAALVASDNSLILLDAASGERLGEALIEAPAVRQIEFFVANNRQWLAVIREGQPEVLLLDATNPANIQPGGMFALERAPQAVTAYDNLIIVADGQTVSIFTVGSEG